MSSIADSYHGLADLLDYPEDRERLVASFGALSAHLERIGVPSPAEPFASFLKHSTLSELQEDYVACFDFNPAAAPYLGHHLFGDNQKKGAYMIRVKQEYGRHDFAPQGVELPDHLAVLLGFLAHLSRRGEDAMRRSFIEELVLPGLKRLVEGQAKRASSPWLSLVEAAELLCSTDCKEVSTC